MLKIIPKIDVKKTATTGTLDKPIITPMQVANVEIPINSQAKAFIKNHFAKYL